LSCTQIQQAICERAKIEQTFCVRTQLQQTFWVRTQIQQTLCEANYGTSEKHIPYEN